MAVEGPIWERYERAVLGGSVAETADFEWMLEEPDEFELRVLVRHFEDREELLDRIGRFEHEPAPTYSEAQIADLASELAAAYKRVASAYASEQFPWAESTDELPIRYVGPDHERPSSTESSVLFQCLADAVDAELSHVVGGSALREVLQGRVRSVGLFHLLGPLISVESDFAADLALRKSRHVVWIEAGQLIVRRPVDDPWAHLDAESDGWDPQLDWPTDDDIAQHQQES